VAHFSPRWSFVCKLIIYPPLSAMYFCELDSVNNGPSNHHHYMNLSSIEISPVDTRRILFPHHGPVSSRIGDVAELFSSFEVSEFSEAIELLQCEFMLCSMCSFVLRRCFLLMLP
jgi:hypothetical protein